MFTIWESNEHSIPHALVSKHSANRMTPLANYALLGMAILTAYKLLQSLCPYAVGNMGVLEKSVV
jgi:hypothetical protein